MRANDFFNEDLFGTEPKRPARSGTRPARGHGLEPRYKSAPVVPGGDNPDAPHKPIKGDEPVQRGDLVMVQDPNNIATVFTGTVKRIGREHVYVTLRNGETIAAPHDEVSKNYDVLSKRAHLILNKKGPSRSRYSVTEIEQELDEISNETKKSYKEKAAAQIKDLKPHAKSGEYRDLAQNVIARREKGLTRANRDVDEGWQKALTVGATAASIAAGGALGWYNGTKFNNEVDQLEKVHAALVVKDPTKAAELQKAIDRIKFTKGNAKLNATTRRNIEAAKKLVNDQQGLEECAGVGIVTKQNSTADVGPGTIKKNLKAFKLSDDISVDEGILTTDVAHALKRYGEHVNSDVYKELAKMFSLGKITDALVMLKRLDPEVRKHATNIISGAGGLLGSKLTKESSDDNDYVQQLTNEFVRRAKIGRSPVSAESVLGLLDRFFKKFSISDRYFDGVFNRVMRTTDHEAGILEMEAELEEWKASRKLCRSSTPDSELGASALSSCKAQGLRARDGNKSHKLGKSPKSRVKVGGHRIKGKKYGGPLPDWS